MRTVRRLFFVLAIFCSGAWSAEWVPGQTYFQGDTVELDWSAWMLVAPTNAGWEQLPPYSASLSAVWQPVSIDTCARAWKSGGAYVQNQVVLDSGRLWRLELPSNAGWENWRPQSAFLWAVWSDAGPWEDYGGCLSPSDRDGDGVPDIVGAILETNGDISLFGHPDRWFVDDSNRTVVYDFSSVPGYEESDSVLFAIPAPMDSGSASSPQVGPIVTAVTTSQRGLPKIPNGYHFIGPELRVSVPSGTRADSGVVPFPLPKRVRNASISDILAFVHIGDTVWGETLLIAYWNSLAYVKVGRSTAIRFAVREKDVVWAPGYEQTNFIAWAQNLGDSSTSLRTLLVNSPTFFSPDTIKPNLEIQDAILSQDWENKIGHFRDSVIHPAVEFAAQTGFNTIDLEFFNDSAFHDVTSCSSGNKIACRSYVKYLAFAQWIKEIKRHNLEISGNTLRIRVRMQAMFQHLVEFYQSFNRSAYLVNPSSHCTVCSDSDKDSLLLEITSNPYLAWSLGQYNRNLQGGYFNLKNPLVRRMMKAFFCVSLEELQKETGPEIEIDAVTFALDNDGETGLSYLKVIPNEIITRPGTNDTLTVPILVFQSETDTGDVFPVEWWINYVDHIDDILAFFESRKEVLRQTYVDFATAVKSVIPIFPARRQLTPAIFYQDWVGDALIRGTLFGYDLVRRTGIELYHHTMYAVPFSMQRATQSFPIGIRNAVNLQAGIDSTMNFDTEMSWAHWDRRIITDRNARNSTMGNAAANDLWWEREFLTIENAANFRDQADVAVQADAMGYVLCNWSIQDLLNGPNNKADDTDSTKTAWKRILGDENDEHVYGVHGIVSAGPKTIRKRIAVYISDPVAILSQMSGNWMGMLYGTGNWYDSPGGLFGKIMRFCGEHCEIAVVNDEMILDTEGTILNLYDEVWIAYPHDYSRPELLDTCIARTTRGEAFSYLRHHRGLRPSPMFTPELYPPTF